jgi:hypothetical protein
MHSVKRHGKEIETPLFRFAVTAYLLAIVLPYCLAFRLVAGRLPKKAAIEFNGRSL